ncbi:uncharacterized protein [Euwallacea similis]|uniref:uncharacterized protein n=1 Tax=Euwallacea similis TaxID=1736056 RepID=UPI0034502596
MEPGFRSATPPPSGACCHCLHSPREQRPKSLMESLLVAKMEQVTIGPSAHPQLVRTNSVDSCSSFGSGNSLAASDICRCDDCLLGIADLYVQPTEEKKKKTTTCELRERPLQRPPQHPPGVLQGIHQDSTEADCHLDVVRALEPLSIRAAPF